MKNIDEIVVLLLIYFNLEEDKALKAKTKIFPGIFAGTLFKALLITNSLKEASDLLECSDRTIQRVLRTLYSPPTERGGSIKQQLLKLVYYKYCGKCDNIKYLKEFNLSQSNCKDCVKIKFHNYYENNKKSIMASVINRRLLKISRIPLWADLNKIKEIYNNCPKGYHVDHEIPLQGELVSGLHVENNLQYLTAEDNLKKSNKWIVS